jgi:hypothetical protein
MALKSFPRFVELPPELREMIWQFSLTPRIVELLPSNYCKTSFYSDTRLPVALEVCQDSRNAVRHLYSERFGWNWPGRVLFNFEIDTLYLDSSAIRPLCAFLKGILKEKELELLKYVAFDQRLLVEDGYGLGIRKALRAMTELREMKIVRHVEAVIFPRGGEGYSEGKGQIVFLGEMRSKGRVWALDWTWPDRPEEKLPDVQIYNSWTNLPGSVEVKVVYGWRSDFLASKGSFNCDVFEKKSVGIGQCAWEKRGCRSP